MINYTTPTKAQKSKRTTAPKKTTCTPTTPSKKRPRSHLHPNVHAAAHQATPSLSPPHDRRPSKTLRVNIHGARVANGSGPGARGVQQQQSITPPANSPSATPSTPIQNHDDDYYYNVVPSRSISCSTKKPPSRAHAHARVQSKKTRLCSKEEERTRTRERQDAAMAKRRLHEQEQEREQELEQQAREKRDRVAYEIMQREREVLEFAESRAFAFGGGGACLPTPVRTPSSSGHAMERWMISEEEEMVSEEEVEVDGVVFEEEENSREEKAVRQAWMAELESQKRAFEADCARKLQETEDLLLTRFAQLQATHEADNARYIAQFDTVKQAYMVEKQNAAEQLEAMRSAIVVAIANANAAAQNEEVTRLRAELERARVSAEEMERRANEAIEAELGRMQEAERLRRIEASERATEEMMRFRAQVLEESRGEKEELERLAQKLAADKETLTNEKRRFFAQQERPMRDASMHSIRSDASMDTVAPPEQEEDPTTLIQFFAQRASLLSNFKHATHHPSFTLSFNCVPWPVLKYQRDVTSSLHITRAEIDQFFTHPERPLALGYQPDTLMQWKADRSAWHSDRVVPVLRRWVEERRRDLGDFQDSGLRADAVIEDIDEAMAVVFCYLDDKVKALQAVPRPGD